MKQCCYLMMLLAVSSLPAAPANIVFEAETAAAIEAPMVLVTTTEVPAGSHFVAGASGEVYLEIPEDAGNPPKLNKGLARFSVDVPEAGGYTLWARVYWEGECSNSFTVEIDESAPFLFGENATYKQWHWVKYPVARMVPPINLTKGRHTITFRNREDGVRLDQIILSPNRRFVPVAIEGATTRGDQP